MDDAGDFELWLTGTDDDLALVETIGVVDTDDFELWLTGAGDDFAEVAEVDDFKVELSRGEVFAAPFEYTVSFSPIMLAASPVLSL